jgi:ABC-type proline/glycine betaine transport system permease subunit
MQKIERLLHSTYIYFSSLTKRYFEQCKLAELLETKGKKMLHHVNKKWISMLFLVKGFFKEYKPLVVEMNNDLHAILVAKTPLEFLCGVEVVWASITSCPCWKSSMNLLSLLKVILVLFMTLWGF